MCLQMPSLNFGGDMMSSMNISGAGEGAAAMMEKMKAQMAAQMSGAQSATSSMMQMQMPQMGGQMQMPQMPQIQIPTVGGAAGGTTKTTVEKSDETLKTEKGKVCRNFNGYFSF